MLRFFEFLINHWLLTTLWIALFITLVLYHRAKSGKAVSPHQATLLVNRAEGVFLDVRDRKVFEKGHIVDALNMPLAKLKDHLTELEKYKDKPLIVVCQMGNQSSDAVKILEANGFGSVNRMMGGMAEWQNQSLPVVK